MTRQKPALSIVIGSNGRIGSVAVKSFLKKGNIVIGLDIHAHSSASPLDSRCYYLNGDFSQVMLHKKLGALLDDIADKYSFIECIVNLSRIPLMRTELLAATCEEEVSKAIASVYGITSLIDYLCHATKLANTSIVHVSSLDAWYVSAQPALYNMIKGATLSLSRSLAWKLGKLDIRSNVVIAGLVSDPSVHLDDQASKVQSLVIALKNGPPNIDDIVNAIIFLSSASARSITGACIVVDAGMSLPSTYAVALNALNS